MRPLVFILFAALLHAVECEAYRAKLRSDPSLLQYLHAARYAEAKALQSAALHDPQLILGIDNLPIEDPSFERYLPTSKVIGLAQRFAPARAEEGETMRLDAQRRRLDHAYAQAQLEALFERALIRRAYAQERLKLLEQQQTLLAQLEKQRQGVMDAGGDQRSALALLQERRIELSIMQREAQGALEEVETELTRLLGEVPDCPIPQPSIKPYTQLYPLAIAAAAARTAQSGFETAKAQEGVDWSLQLLYKQRESGGEDWVSLLASLSLPLHGRTQAQSDAAMAQYHQAKSAHAAQSLEWSAAMQRLRQRIETLEAQSVLQHRRIEAITQTFEAQSRAYGAAQSTLEPLIESSMRRLQSALEHLRLRTQMQQSIIEYNTHIME